MKLMVSRRNFISITLLMLVLFGLFQFFLVIKDRENDYSANEFLSDSPWTAEDVWRPEIILSDETVPAGDYVVYIGSSGSMIYHTVEQWCTYSKRNLMECSSVQYYQIDQDHPPTAILIDGENINTETDVAVLDTLAGGEVPLIFCTIPDAKTIKEDPALMSLLGIDEVGSESVDAAGIHVFSGFLLGGESVYRLDSQIGESGADAALAVPWYHIVSGAEVYISGEFQEHSTDVEVQLPLLWSYGNGNNRIFAVCGDYIKDLSGMGFLEAMISEFSDYDLYPVVNAQCFSVVGFPNLTNENTQQLKEIYSRDQASLYRDVVWPDLIAVMEESGFALTCFLSPQSGYAGSEELSEEELVFYFKQLKEWDAEIGLSMRMNVDSAAFDGMENGYPYSSAYAGYDRLGSLQEHLSEPFLEELRTIVTDAPESEPLFSYMGQEAVVQRITHRANDYGYTDDLRLKGYETALGYSNILLDMTDIVWPESEEDEWQNWRTEIYSNIGTYWKPYQYFEKTVSAESSRRIQNYLSLFYTAQRNGDEISVSIENFHDSAWFILRTHGEQVENIQGGSYTQIEEDVYFIEAYGSELTIDLAAAGNGRDTE